MYSPSAKLKKSKIMALMVLISLIVHVWSCSTYNKGERQPLFKNVVVIVGDDHAHTALGAYENKVVKTPNLDRLAENGTMFLNAYANSPPCSALRQSILTGKYPHATGVNLLFTPFNDGTNVTIAEHLKENGFATALIGKQHFNTWQWAPLYKDGLPSFGFDTLIDNTTYRNWLANQNSAPIPDSIPVFGKDGKDLPEHITRMNPFTLPHPYRDEYAKGTFLANAAIDFLDRHKEKPFFLWLAFNEPHAPFAFPIEYAGKYSAADVELPRGGPQDERWIPQRFKGFSKEQKKGVIAAYYTSVNFLDKNVGLVIEALKKKDLYDDTLIIYLGDQGYLLNEHDRFEKHTMWEESIKAPLIIAGGDRYRGKVVEQPVEFIDIALLIADITGVSPMEEAQGTSLNNLLGDREVLHKKYVFAEFLEDNKAMVANKEWKYVFSTGKRDLGQGYETGHGAYGIHHRLYNLETDPGEMENLAYRENLSERVATMQKAMLEIFDQTHPYAHELPENLTDIGKLVWFCEPRDVGAEYGGEPLPIIKPGGSR